MEHDLPLYATPAHIRAGAYGLDIPDEAEHQMDALILKAERRLLRRVPSIPAKIAREELDAETVADVVTDIVLRVIRNPGGYSSEQAGEFSYRLDWAAASGRIHITREDIANLGATSQKAYGSFRSDAPNWRIIA